MNELIESANQLGQYEYQSNTPRALSNSSDQSERMKAILEALRKSAKPATGENKKKRLGLNSLVKKINSGKKGGQKKRQTKRRRANSPKIQSKLNDDIQSEELKTEEVELVPEEEQKSSIPEEENLILSEEEQKLLLSEVENLASSEDGKVASKNPKQPEVENPAILKKEIETPENLRPLAAEILASPEEGKVIPEESKVIPENLKASQVENLSLPENPKLQIDNPVLSEKDKVTPVDDSRPLEVENAVLSKEENGTSKNLKPLEVENPTSSKKGKVTPDNQNPLEDLKAPDIDNPGSPENLKLLEKDSQALTEKVKVTPADDPRSSEIENPVLSKEENGTPKNLEPSEVEKPASPEKGKSISENLKPPEVENLVLPKDGNPTLSTEEKEKMDQEERELEHKMAKIEFLNLLNGRLHFLLESKRKNIYSIFNAVH